VKAASVRLARAALLPGLLLACTPPERVVLMHPQGGEAARRLVRIDFTQTVTALDNFVRRPDEFAAVAVDHPRSQLYVGSREGSLIALDRADGTVLWEVELGGAVSSRPVLVDPEGDAPRSPLLLVGTDNGELIALDLETREPRWRYRTDGKIRNEAVVREGVVYFANSRDQIFALDVRTGEWRWQYEQEFQTDFTIHGRAGLTYLPAHSGLEGLGDGEPGVIFTGFDNGKVAAIGAGSGDALWLASVAPAEGGDFVDCDSTPLLLLDRQEVVVAGQSTGVHALSLLDGAVRWKFPVRGAGSVVEGPSGELLFASSLEGIFSLERDGHLRWRSQVDPGVLSTPVHVGDALYVTHSERGWLAFDTAAGEFLAQIDIGSGMSSVPVYDPIDERFYVTSNRGVLLALSLHQAAAERWY